MNKEEHPYISLIKSDDPKLIRLGYRMILDTVKTSAILGLFKSKEQINNKIFNFTDTSETKGETLYEWDFGDNSPKVFTKNASHEFKEGIYTITHKITNKFGISELKQELEVD